MLTPDQTYTAQRLLLTRKQIGAACDMMRDGDPENWRLMLNQAMKQSVYTRVAPKPRAYKLFGKQS